jgi:hypothetical protein
LWIIRVSVKSEEKSNEDAARHVGARSAVVFAVDTVVGFIDLALLDGLVPANDQQNGPDSAD